MRAVTSSAVAAEPVVSPAIQPATPRPAVTDTTPSRAAVASIPRIVASRIVGSAPLSARRIVDGAPSSAGRIVRTAPPSPAAIPDRDNGPAVTLVHRLRPRTRYATAAGRL